jgi:hypothetical protein
MAMAGSVAKARAAVLLMAAFEELPAIHKDLLIRVCVRVRDRRSLNRVERAIPLDGMRLSGAPRARGLIREGAQAASTQASTRGARSGHVSWWPEFRRRFR